MQPEIIPLQRLFHSHDLLKNQFIRYSMEFSLFITLVRNFSSLLALSRIYSYQQICIERPLMSLINDYD